MTAQMRLLSHLHGEVDEQISERFPEVEVVEVPQEGNVDASVVGDALLTVVTLGHNIAQLAGRVQWIHNFGTGVDGLPDEAFSVPLLTCSRGAGAVPISEFVLAAMLAFEKHLPDVWVHEPPPRWAEADLGGLMGRTAGLVGIGGIGEAIAQRALAFGTNVIAFRRRSAPPPLPEIRVVSSLEELLPACDHLVLAAPLTPHTRHLLDARAFGLVRPGVHLVNIARGGLIDQEALRVALDDDRVAMATLDTVDPEPLPAGDWMYSHPRVRLSPHVSWSSPEGARRILELFLDNLGRYLADEPLEGVVDPGERY
jgi:phosphoglycerate dehydrogenase-like enzyme